MRGLFTLIFARLVFARQYPNEKSHLILPPEHPFAGHFQDLATAGFSGSLSGRPSMSRWQTRIEEFLSLIEPQPPQKPAVAASPRRAEEIYKIVRQKIAAATNNAIVLNESYDDFKKDFKDGFLHPFFTPWR